MEIVTYESTKIKVHLYNISDKYFIDVYDKNNNYKKILESIYDKRNLFLMYKHFKTIVNDDVTNMVMDGEEK